LVTTPRLRLCVLAWLVPALLAARPWEQPLTPIVAEGQKASDCGACHTEIYAEWKRSTHAKAWTDPQFQAELHKDTAVGWMCLNCHTPVTNQQAMLVEESGLVRDPHQSRNPSFDSDWQSEGVTCLSCHWRSEGIASAHKDVQAPHPTVYSPDLMEDGQCNQCHQAVARIESALVCHFNTGHEKKVAGITETCQSCHMARIERPMVVGGPVRVGGRHTWGGSGIAKDSTPAHPGLNGLDLQVSAPTRAVDGERVKVIMTLSNVRAGHMVPSGDPERHVVLRVSGAEGAEKEWRIGQEWQWSPVSRKLSDNRLKPAEAREHNLSFTMPAESVDLRITVDHIRMSEANLNYHIKQAEEGHAGPSVDALKAYPTRRRLFDEQVHIDLSE
jgi:hypothetical protein